MVILPDFWLAGLLITAETVFVEFVDVADFMVLADFVEFDEFDLPDLLDKALVGFED